MQKIQGKPFEDHSIRGTLFAEFLERIQIRVYEKFISKLISSAFILAQDNVWLKEYKNTSEKRFIIMKIENIIKDFLS